MQADPDDDLRRHPHPFVTVDVCLCTLHDLALHVLVQRRPRAPFADAFALPGGFVRIDETLEQAAARVLRQKAGLDGVFLEQLFTFGRVDRDPRGRVLSVAYYALVPATRLQEIPTGSVLARIDVPWTGTIGGAVRLRADGDELPVAFDHADMVGMVVQRLRGKIDYAPVGFELLPDRFTLLELQGVHEAVLGTPINKDSFRRRMLASGLLVGTGRRQRGVGHRPAELFRFRPPRRGGHNP